jgi:protein ImuB
MAPRLVTVWCPEWPAVAAGTDPTAPAAVLRANRVVARTPAAIVAGVRAGQRRRDAQRTCPELTLVDHDPARDARAFEPVVRAVAELAPRLEVIEPGWLTLAARGPSRYFGGDEALGERLGALVAGLIGGGDSGGGSGGGTISDGAAPIAAVPIIGVGIADGRAPSAIAARRAAHRARAVHPRSHGGAPTVERGARHAVEAVEVVAPGGSAAYVAPLSVAWLRELGEATPELVDLLDRLGVRTLGALAALGASDVLGRFGNDGLHAHRLATGGDDRPPDVTDPPPERSVERTFDEPVVQTDPVVFVAKQLADELAAALAAEGRVCTRLIVTTETDHGERCERAWYRDAGLSAAAMVERVRWQLDGWLAHPGAVSAGVVLLRLAPDEVRGDDGRQLGLWGGRSQADHDAARAIARLTGLAGEAAVRVPVWHGGRLPDERYRWVPATTVDLERTSVGPAAEHPWPGATPRPSPTVVLNDAVRVELVDATGAPLRVSGRGELSTAPAALVVGGRVRAVQAWAGPWPIDQRWWESRRHRRLARLHVVTDDGMAHHVIAEQQGWWLTAVY